MSSGERWDGALALGALLLAAVYFWFYFAAPDLPDPYSQGWWGWFDQGKTLESAKALAMRDLSPARHWYPLGYAMLGAPFIRFGFRAHPFVLVDLAALLVTYGAFVHVAARCGVRRSVAVALFLFAAFCDRQVFREWVIPWNSTPASALVWLIFAVASRWFAGERRPLLLGALAGFVPLFRPTEAVPVAVAVLWLLAAEWRAGRLDRPILLRLAAAAAVPVLLQVVLHLAIYGSHLNEYQLVSRELGFTLYDFGWKAYVILADPYPWFMDGQGLLARLPWAALAFAGLLPALWRGGTAGMLAAALIAHLVLYVSYLDLLPTGLWRYNNIHYWKWAVPGYALLGWLLLRDLARWPLPRSSWPAVAGLALAVALAPVRVAPRPAAPGEPAKMLEFHGNAPGFAESYFGDFVLTDAGGQLRNVPDIRAFPVPGGMRVIALRRPLLGSGRFEAGHAPSPELIGSVPTRWAEQVVLGRPCWLAIARCGRREVNGLLPPPPG